MNNQLNKGADIMGKDIQAAAQVVIQRAIERHGGMARYDQVGHIVCDVTTMGGFGMSRRGLHTKFPIPKIVTLFPSQNKAILHDYPVAGRDCVYDNGRVAEVASGQTPVFECDNHRVQMLSVSRFRRPWTTLDAAYFFGYAMTHYASLPFSLPGLKVVGFAQRDDGPWRSRIDFEYPKGSHTHSQHETLYFDATNLLVRHDYCPEVSSPLARAANFLHEYRDFDGYLITERRKVHFRLGRMVTPLVVMDASIKVLEVGRIPATVSA
ncbi:MAG: hypothetical protein ACLGI6_15250 [Gammaproteobacteria bacterium]